MPHIHEWKVWVTEEPPHWESGILRSSDQGAPTVGPLGETIDTSKSAITQEFDDLSQYDADGNLCVAPNVPAGTEKKFYSPCLCQPMTWWQNPHTATREALALDSGLVYNSPHQNWIRTVNGTIFGEDLIRTMIPTIIPVVEQYDGVTYTTLTDTTDYSIDYATGTVTLINSPGTDTIWASYQYAQTEYTYVIAPDEGKALNVVKGKVLYSTDIQSNFNLTFEVWAGPAEGKVKIEELIFKNTRQIYLESGTEFHHISAHSGWTSDLLEVGLAYTARRQLKYSDGAEIRITSPTALTGETAHIVFTCLEMDEA